MIGVQERSFGEAPCVVVRGGVEGARSPTPCRLQPGKPLLGTVLGDGSTLQFLRGGRRTGRLDERPEEAGVAPRELSRPGWRLRLGQPGQTRAAVGDRLISADEIEAMASLLSWVGPYELTDVVEPDREYVASEMTAFLLAWLSELPCPVVDRPTPQSLAGCGRWPAEWAELAHSVGVRADPHGPVRRSSSPRSAGVWSLKAQGQTGP